MWLAERSQPARIGPVPFISSCNPLGFYKDVFSRLFWVTWYFTVDHVHLMKRYLHPWWTARYTEHRYDLIWLVYRDKMSELKMWVWKHLLWADGQNKTSLLLFCYPALLFDFCRGWKFVSFVSWAELHFQDESVKFYFLKQYEENTNKQKMFFYYRWAVELQFSSVVHPQCFGCPNIL